MLNQAILTGPPMSLAVARYDTTQYDTTDNTNPYNSECARLMAQMSTMEQSTKNHHDNSH